jgi:tRNA(fMet)-specific endonuclease VapC
VSLRFLLDTSIVSEPLRPSPNVAIVRRLQRHASEVGIAAIVWHELWFGCHKLPRSQKRTTIAAYLNDVVAVTMPILPYDERAAKWHAGEQARLVGAGRTPSFVDGQIAAIAAVNELTLVTINASDFRDFANLSVTDWAG